MSTSSRVYITATSAVSSAGADAEVLFERICEGDTGIGMDVEYFYPSTPAIGKIQTEKSFEFHLRDQCQQILEVSGREDFHSTLLVIGSSVGGMYLTEKRYFQDGDYRQVDPKYHPIHALAVMLEETFHFYDTLSFSTACTSSANAIGYAYEVLSKGVYESVLVVGADALSKTTVGGFLSLGVLSSDPCRPFDKQRDGMNVGEAIACLLLEREAKDHAVEVCGVGYSSDAYHMTHPHPEGEGAQIAMNNAMKSAGIEPEQISYINAHGTGTPANDSAEAHAIATLFPHRPYVSSTKSITGHTLGAAGALEAVISCKAILKEQVPPNTFLSQPENVQLHLPRKSVMMPIGYALSNSFAFGGNNCSLIFGRVE
jgi:3-oxoacyl-[acyl-carrier-protein] synthase-1